jgi:hypothetical protein
MLLDRLGSPTPFSATAPLKMLLRSQLPVSFGLNDAPAPKLSPEAAAISVLLYTLTFCAAACGPGASRPLTKTAELPAFQTTLRATVKSCEPASR